MFAIIASWVLNICACFSFPFSTSLAYKASSSSRILSSFSDFSRGNSVTSAPLLCCLFTFLSQSSLAFLLVSPSLSRALERISVFLRSVSTLLLLQDSPVYSASFSLSEISSNNTSIELCWFGRCTTCFCFFFTLLSTSSE